ncbi:MAG: hypothetical protein K6G06_05675 [Butyrivibrio sp.]|nr:hypothetical protein [Butyrivibrio sp.]
MTNSKKSKIALLILFLIGLCIVAIPVVSACGYTYLCEDDFSFEGGAKDLSIGYGSSVIGAAHRTVEYYNSWQGTFVFTFLIHVLRVYYRWDLPGLHLYMIINCVLFIFSLYTLLKTLTKDKMSGAILLSVAMFLIFAMKGTLPGMETFFWYTGTLNFTLELSMSFLSCSLLIKNVRGELKSRGSAICLLIVSCLFAFLASGGALNIASSNCGWMLAVVIIYGIGAGKGFKWQSLLPFISALTGAIINVVAPGNYVRSNIGLAKGHMTVFDALRDTFVLCSAEDKLFFTSFSFVLPLILLFAVCVYLQIQVTEYKSKWYLVLIAFVGTWLVRFFTLFPVCFGYHSDVWGNLRTRSAYDIVAKLMYMLFVMFLAQFVWEKLETGKVYKFIPAGAAILTVVLTLTCYAPLKAELKEGMSYNVIQDFKTGAMVETYTVREYVLSSFRTAEPGSDCILTVPPFNKASSMYGMGITVDSEEFVNRSAAGLYDLHTTTVIYQD